MSISKKIRLIFQFYRNYFFASSIITIFGLTIYLAKGFETITSLFWFKILTLALTYYFIKSYKSKEFYYYQNLGVSSTLLWTTTLVIDFLIFIASLIITSFLR